MSTAAGMVKAGLGVTILPSSAFEMGELTGLRSRPIKTPALTREIGVIEKNGRSLSPAAESFLKPLKPVCKELKSCARYHGILFQMAGICPIIPAIACCLIRLAGRNQDDQCQGSDQNLSRQKTREDRSRRPYLIRSEQWRHLRFARPEWGRENDYLAHTRDDLAAHRRDCNHRRS